MRYNFSFSVTDEKLAVAIKSFRDSGGNLSKLICNLLQHYFFGDNNSKELLTKEMVKLLEIEKKINEFWEWADKIKPEIQELKEKLAEKQEQQELQDALPLIRELHEIVFEDLQDYEEFEAHCRRLAREPADAIKVRLSKWAAEKQLSMPQAVNLFFKAFPELKEKLEGRL
ncbi:hypothetical protein [Archaeoglobus sp.]